MINVADLQNLIDSWQERADSPVQPFSYKNALLECIYDLNKLISQSIEEEMAYQDFLQQEADAYLSSIEAHEQVI